MEQNTGLDDLISAAAMGDVESHGHQQPLLTEGTSRAQDSGYHLSHRLFNANFYVIWAFVNTFV